MVHFSAVFNENKGWPTLRLNKRKMTVNLGWVFLSYSLESKHNPGRTLMETTPNSCFGRLFTNYTPCFFTPYIVLPLQPHSAVAPYLISRNTHYSTKVPSAEVSWNNCSSSKASSTSLTTMCRASSLEPRFQQYYCTRLVKVFIQGEFVSFHSFATGKNMVCCPGIR